MLKYFSIYEQSFIEVTTFLEIILRIWYKQHLLQLCFEAQTEKTGLGESYGCELNRIVHRKHTTYFMWEEWKGRGVLK